MAICVPATESVKEAEQGKATELANVTKDTVAMHVINALRVISETMTNARHVISPALINAWVRNPLTVWPAKKGTS